MIPIICEKQIPRFAWNDIVGVREVLLVRSELVL